MIDFKKCTPAQTRTEKPKRTRFELAAYTNSATGAYHIDTTKLCG